MAKKNNEGKKSLLSERMKKTPHHDNNGAFSQQTEINIFVSQDQPDPNPQFNPNIPQNQTGQYYQPSQEIFQQQSNPIPQNDFQKPSTNGKFHINDTPSQEPITTPSSITPLIEQEFVFDADGSGSGTLQEEYVSPFAKSKKPKKVKKEKPVHQYGENAITGENGDPFARKPIPKKAKLIILCSLLAFILIFPQLLFRIPAFFDDDVGEFTAKVTNNTKEINEYITVQNGMQDWDKDGIANSTDNDVWNPDMDRNGIPDGETSKSFISANTTITYENITIPVDKANVGMSKFLNYYTFSNYKGWAKIDNVSGIPYIYQDNGWTQAKYRKDGNTFYVYIPSDCYIEFVSKDVIDVYRTDLFGDRAFASKTARYVENKGAFAKIESILLKLILPSTEPTKYTIASVWHTTNFHLNAEKNIVKSEALKPSKENYNMAILKDYEFSYNKLYSLYDNTDNGKTTLISFITKDGEVTCFAYAYDYLGNFYVADAQTSKTLGKITVTPKSQVYYKDSKMFIREWYEFEGIGLSSENGDKMFIY